MRGLAAGVGTSFLLLLIIIIILFIYYYYVLIHDYSHLAGLGRWCSKAATHCPAPGTIMITLRGLAAGVQRPPLIALHPVLPHSAQEPVQVRDPPYEDEHFGISEGAVGETVPRCRHSNFLSLVSEFSITELNIFFSSLVIMYLPPYPRRYSA